MAWLLPVLIDGLVLTGSLGVIAATLSGVGTWYPWMLTIFGVAASVAGNVAAAPDNLVAQLVHATPPIVFALAIEGLLRIWRAGAENRAAVKAVEQAKAEAEAARELARAQREAKRSEREAQQSEPPVTVKQITPVKVKTNGPSARQRIQELLISEPEIAGAEVARRLGIDPSHARKLLREIRGTVAETTQTEDVGGAPDPNFGQPSITSPSTTL